MKILPFVAVTALAGFAPASAWAQPPDGIDYSASLDAEDARDPGLPRFTVSAGGGMTRFIKAEARSYLRSGGAWAVRGGLPLSRSWQVEATYVGSAQGIKGDGDADVTLYGHGLEASVRCGYGLAAGGLTVEPFAFAGFGVTRFKFSGTSNDRPALLGSADLIGVIPAGLGVAVHYGRTFVDVRGSFRYTLDDNALVFKPARAPNDQSYVPLDHVTVGAVVGRAF